MKMLENVFLSIGYTLFPLMVIPGDEPKGFHEKCL